MPRDRDCCGRAAFRPSAGFRQRHRAGHRHRRLRDHRRHLRCDSDHAGGGSQLHPHHDLLARRNGSGGRNAVVHRQRRCRHRPERHRGAVGYRHGTAACTDHHRSRELALGSGRSAGHVRSARRRDAASPLILLLPETRNARRRRRAFSFLRPDRKAISSVVRPRRQFLRRRTCAGLRQASIRKDPGVPAFRVPPHPARSPAASPGVRSAAQSTPDQCRCRDRRHAPCAHRSG